MRSQMKYYLAIDIGASSGRHIVGWEENGALRTEEVYRFPNGVREEAGHLVWDIAALFSHVKAGIRAAFAKYPHIGSLAIDTWAVDYVLMQGEKELLPCHAYRDGRTKEAVAAVHARVPFEKLYERTGIQFQPFNTVYQLTDDLMQGRLNGVTDFLMIPEYLSYKLTGIKAHEYTNATTTGLVNAQTGAYDRGLTEAVGLPAHLFGALSAPGSRVGALLPEIAAEAGGNTQVVLCASHDTASAVEGIPMSGGAYLSSGTWSLLGAKVPAAICSDMARSCNFSNEGGVGYTRFQKNIMGMWVINRLKAELAPEQSFDDVMHMGQESTFDGTVDVTDERFLAPESMKAAFDGCFEEGARPHTAGDYFRCAHRSLALGYRKALEELAACTGKAYDKLYIVGGGAKNAWLNELTEQACGVKVVALPIEATAIGNLKIQIRRGKTNE